MNTRHRVGLDYYRLFIFPDDVPWSIEDFDNIDAAAKRGAQILRDEDPEWSEADCIASLKAGHICCHGTYGTVHLGIRKRP